MKANELRIGNFVYDIEHGLESIIKGIDGQWNDVYLIANNEKEIRRDVRDIQSIELTEEWLVKFGFEKEKTSDPELFYSDFENNEGTRLRMYWPMALNEASLHHKPTKGEWYPLLLKNIKYVHQLQNLYFALTGEELEIK